MEHTQPHLSPCERYARILTILEGQLAELDRAGAHKAGAHLDAAIQQLRRDHKILRAASAAQGATPIERGGPSASPSRKTAILTPFSPAFSEALGTPQVFPRKATR